MTTTNASEKPVTMYDHTPEPWEAPVVLGGDAARERTGVA